MWGRWKTEVARHGQAYKERIVARLLPPASSSVEHVSREIGISVATLERWWADALALDQAVASNAGRRRHVLQVVIATAAMDEATLSGWCREQGLYASELDAWKQDAIAGLGEPCATSAVEARGDRRRDKALAETAALLVLSKELGPVARLWWQKRVALYPESAGTRTNRLPKREMGILLTE